MHIRRAISLASHESAVCFLLTTYLESLCHLGLTDRISARTAGLALCGPADVLSPLQALLAAHDAAGYAEGERAQIAEALAVFAGAAERLRIFDGGSTRDAAEHGLIAA